MRHQLSCVYVVVLAMTASARPLASQSPAAPAATAVPQNPSPMVERTRAHERLVPETRSDPDPIDLVVHFHGAEWLAEQSVARLADGRVSA